MPRYAVSRLSFFDNELHTKIVTEETWFEALLAAFPDMSCIYEDEDMEKAKCEAFNSDELFEVVEIPEL